MRATKRFGRIAKACLTLLLAGVLCWLIWLVGGQRGRAEKAIRALGADVGVTATQPSWVPRPLRWASKGMFKRVTWVSSRKGSMTDADLRQVGKLTHLRGVNLWNAEVTDKGLAHLASLVELRTLILAGPGITDAGLVHLKGMPQLWELYLVDTSVTDAGLVHLHGLKRLHFVALDRTAVTDTGVARLQKALPGISVRR